MQLFGLNASPRGAKSSSKIMMDHLVAGFLETSGNQVMAMNLTDMMDNMEALIDALNNADNIIIAHPLYIDSMPAVTLSFFNEWVLKCDAKKRRNLGFILPYGFPESTHAQAVKKYHEKLAKRLNCHYLGTLSRGYCNRLEGLEEERTKPVFEQLHPLGRDLGKSGRFNAEDVDKLTGLEMLPKRIQWKINLLFNLPMNKSFLMREFWVHGTYRQRNARPYLKQS